MRCMKILYEIEQQPGGIMVIVSANMLYAGLPNIGIGGFKELSELLPEKE